MIVINNLYIQACTLYNERKSFPQTCEASQPTTCIYIHTWYDTLLPHQLHQSDINEILNAL